MAVDGPPDPRAAERAPPESASVCSGQTRAVERGAHPGGKEARPDGDLWRAKRLVEDTVRAHPEGAADIVIIDRLVRTGLAPGEALDLIEALRRDGKIHLRAGRWHAL